MFRRSYLKIILWRYFGVLYHLKANSKYTNKQIPNSYVTEFNFNKRTKLRFLIGSFRRVQTCDLKLNHCCFKWFLIMSRDSKKKNPSVIILLMWMLWRMCLDSKSTFMWKWQARGTLYILHQPTYGDFYLAFSFH